MSEEIDFKIIISSCYDTYYKCVKVYKDATEIVSERFKYSRSQEKLYCMAADATVKEINNAFQYIGNIKNYALVIPKYKFSSFNGDIIKPSETSLTSTTDTLPVQTIDNQIIDIINITYTNPIEVNQWADTNDEYIQMTFEAKSHNICIKSEKYQTLKNYYHDDKPNDWLLSFITKLVQKIDSAYKIVQVMTNDNFVPNIQIYMNGNLVNHKEIVDNYSDAFTDEGEIEFKVLDGYASDDNPWMPHNHYYESRYNSDDDDF